MTVTSTTSCTGCCETNGPINIQNPVLLQGGVFVWDLFAVEFATELRVRLFVAPE